jgi:hypothetical protein
VITESISKGARNRRFMNATMRQGRLPAQCLQAHPQAIVPHRAKLGKKAT